MNYILSIFYVIVIILLVIAIMLQPRESGLSGLFGGGEGNIFKIKRGAEKILFIITIILGILFLGLSFILFIFQ